MWALLAQILKLFTSAAENYMDIKPPNPKSYSLYIVRQRSIILYILGLSGQTRVSYRAVLGDIKRTAVEAFDLISSEPP